MSSILITPRSEDDINFLKKMARKMGFTFEVIDVPKKKTKAAAIKEVREGIESGLKEVEQIRSGKKKGRTLEEFLNEVS